jgi:hypothetical protein
VAQAPQPKTPVAYGYDGEIAEGAAPAVSREASVHLLEKLIALANDPDDRLNHDEYDTIIEAFTVLSRTRPIKLGQKWVTQVTSSDGPDVSVIGPRLPVSREAEGAQDAIQELSKWCVWTDESGRYRLGHATDGDSPRPEEWEVIGRALRALAASAAGAQETPPSDEDESCPKRDDGQHCSCWYDAEACCACGAPALSRPETEERS